MKKFTSKKVASKKVASSGKSFEDLMRAVPMDAFSRMVMSSGLPAPDARELCASFKELSK